MEVVLGSVSRARRLPSQPPHFHSPSGATHNTPLDPLAPSDRLLVFSTKKSYPTPAASSNSIQSRLSLAALERMNHRTVAHRIQKLLKADNTCMDVLIGIKGLGKVQLAPFLN